MISNQPRLCIIMTDIIEDNTGNHRGLLCILRIWKVQVQRASYSPATMPWASYQIRKIAGCACAGNAGNVFPRRRFQRKPLVSDPGMHHGTCVTHVPWCMSGSRTRGGGENVPGIPGACAPAISRIWQEAHVIKGNSTRSSNLRRIHQAIWETNALILGKNQFNLNSKGMRSIK